MKNVNQKDISLPQDRFLFVGTNEQVAKSAPNKGLPPLTLLTDVYTGFFCRQNSKVDEKWGIISINLNDLRSDMLAPSLGYLDKFTKNKNTTTTEERYQKIMTTIGKHKSKWEKSLETVGVCMYLAAIPASAIRKVMIYTSTGRDGNVIINEYINNSPNPTIIAPADHKVNYKKYLGVSRWLNGEDVKGEDICEEKVNMDFESKLAHRYGLDVYYIKPLEKGKKSAAKKS